ncbi:MAG TPA: S53 family peptidase [Gaiellaceae bacterium]|nr:S53 family peptidase [Gaiellaceae bacterium]
MKQKLMIAAAAAVFVALVGASASSAAGPGTHRINVDPQISGPQQMSPSSHTFSCQGLPIDGSQGPRCYQASQIQQAYGYSGLLSSGIDGRGETIVIIDAFSSPTIASDLEDFDRDMGLPDPSFTITPVGNVPAFDINDDTQFGWAGEISLDVQWAHAMAPGAAIDLVEAASNSDADIFAATKYAVDHKLGDVISQSFGEAESCVDAALLKQETALFAKATHEGMTLFASTGDSGASQPSCDGGSAVFAAPYPASDPSVTGVGGTTLNADPVTGSYIGETAWSEPLFGCNFPAIDYPTDINCSGGGFSTVFGRPSWQRSMVKGGEPHPRRGVPDVAYDAGVNGGVLVHIGWFLAALGYDPDAPLYLTFGGTSAGSPQWAGLAADADQMAGHDLGNVNDNLYKLAHDPQPHGAAPLHDVTMGNNDVAEIGGQGYNAGPGWDAVTGLGTPNAAALLPALSKKH